MTPIALDPSYFAGAASVERLADGWTSHRLPHTQRHLFPSPGDTLLANAAHTSGVRLRFETDATALTLRFQPLCEMRPQMDPAGHPFDVVIGNEIVRVGHGLPGATEVTLAELPAGRRVLELWLPPSSPLVISELLVDGTFARPIPDRRPLWVTWGSSLTHCVRAGSAARIWPATVARRHDLNLQNLGFGGQCHLDPMVARVIRDLPADFISLKVGVNIMGQGSLSPRTFKGAVIGFVQIIREKHDDIPIALISPIISPARETADNAVGLSLVKMRAEVADAARRIRETCGDENLAP